MKKGKCWKDDLCGSEFECWKADLYGTCKGCLKIHGGMCDYSVVMNFKPVYKRSRCPVCAYKEGGCKEDKTKCANCPEKQIKSK